MADEIKAAEVSTESAAVKDPEAKKRITKAVFSVIFLIGANLIFFFLLWLIGRYDNPALDQILFQAKASYEGTNGDLMTGAFIRVGVLGFLTAGLEFLLYFILSGRFASKIKWNKYVKYCATRVCDFFKRHAMSLTSMLLVASTLIFALRLDVFSYFSATSTPSEFIEQNYVDPKDASISFPEQKRNLIYIFLESMENTFADPTAGGSITENFMPELTELADKNISFSSTEGVGGAQSFFGTTWTAAALVSQTSGVTVKVSLFTEKFGDGNSFLPGLVTIGDILEAQGYAQTVLFGSDARFAGRDEYFTEHGNYNIVDTQALKADGRLPEDYLEWWGFEDEKLFAYAKEEILKLASGDKPFNFTMLTADTHFPDGYECRLCRDEYDEQYSNVIRCSARQVTAFIEWIQEQDFYDNTTIVISGDHLTMDPEFLKDINEGYNRTVYNCIINSPIEAAKETNRTFGVFDMFPTTLAAIGATIEGDRLGLGTNLFSATPTLAETYGYEELNNELLKKSEFYNESFFGNDEEK